MEARGLLSGKVVIVESGVHVETNTKSLAHVLAKAEEDGLTVFDIDISRVNSKQDLLTRIKAGLSLPSYFGANWDALEECLREVAGSPGILLVLRSADALLVLPASDRQILISILSESARFWERERIRFSTVLVRFSFFSGSNSFRGMSNCRRLCPFGRGRLLFRMEFRCGSGGGLCTMHVIVSDRRIRVRKVSTEKLRVSA